MSSIRSTSPSQRNSTSMFYSIRHLTRFDYDGPVSESSMEARLRPRTEGAQRCLQFDLRVQPKAQVYSYRDYLGNTIHHFDVPAQHQRLTIVSEAVVEVEPPAPLPDRLSPDAWREMDAIVAAGEHWEMT